LLENGCAVHPNRVKFAAGLRDVTCVRIPREYGMPWSDVTLLVASGMANNDVLNYAMENGCPNPTKIPVRRRARLLANKLDLSLIFILIYVKYIFY